MIAALAAAAVVLAAELGDKSQLVVLTQAGSSRPGRTIAALAVVIAVLQGIGATVGAAVGAAVPEDVVGYATGALFLGFSVVTWRQAPEQDQDPSGRRSLVRLLAMFFVAELGDKTNLAAASLAAQGEAVAVWIGATAGMVAATWLALLAGTRLRRRVGTRRLTLVGAAAFALVGVATVVATAAG